MITKIIVIVDDDVRMSRVWAQWLTEAGFEAVACNDGDTALQIIGEKKPSLILMDVLMPKKDGIALAREIRANLSLSTIPIVMMSGIYRDPNSRTQMKQAADDFLDKPFERKQLLDKITQYIPIPAHAAPTAPPVTPPSTVKPSSTKPLPSQNRSSESSQGAQSVQTPQTAQKASGSAHSSPRGAANNPVNKTTSSASPISPVDNKIHITSSRSAASSASNVKKMTPGADTAADDEITDIHFPVIPPQPKAPHVKPTSKEASKPQHDIPSPVATPADKVHQAPPLSIKKSNAKDWEFSSLDEYPIDLPVFDDEITLVRAPEQSPSSSYSPIKKTSPSSSSTPSTSRSNQPVSSSPAPNTSSPPHVVAPQKSPTASQSSSSSSQTTSQGNSPHRKKSLSDDIIQRQLEELFKLPKK